MKQLLAVAALAACGSPASVQVDGAGGGGDSPGGMFESFAPKTRSYGHSLAMWQLSLTDGMGPIACGLSSDQHNSYGAAGHQVVVGVVSDGRVGGDACPSGTYSLTTMCPPAPPEANAGLPENCAYYREWDAQGNVIAVMPATAGAITISYGQPQCSFQVMIRFAGQTFSDSFTLYEPTASSGPWCAQ